MKNYLYIIVVFLILCTKNSNAQINFKTDTIYIRVFDEDVRSKFYSTYENQYRIGFSFKVDWTLHRIRRDVIFFSYYSPKKNGMNEWSIYTKDEKEFLLYKNYYTLENFTKALSKDDFLTLIINKKVQIVLLYGSKCYSKVEIYPVKIETDLSSEG